MIELKSITKKFEKSKVKVLKNLNYTFKKGKIYSLTGPSGSGKSTLLNIISMIDRPTSGKLIINKKTINYNNSNVNDKIRAQQIGIVYQDDNLLSDFTALENVYLSRLALVDNVAEALLSARKILKKTGLNRRLDHYPSELSGGEKQRIAISRAIINTPSIILADEPTGSLDQKNSREIFSLLMKLKNKNRIIIFATHNMYFSKMADCQLELTNGRIVSKNARVANK